MANDAKIKVIFDTNEKVAKKFSLFTILKIQFKITFHNAYKSYHNLCIAFEATPVEIKRKSNISAQ